MAVPYADGQKHFGVDERMLLCEFRPKRFSMKSYGGTKMQR